MSRSCYAGATGQIILPGERHPLRDATSSRVRAGRERVEQARQIRDLVDRPLLEGREQRLLIRMTGGGEPHQPILGGGQEAGTAVLWIGRPVDEAEVLEFADRPAELALVHQERLRQR